MFHNLLVDLGYTVLDIDYREVMDTDVILEQEFTVYGRKDLTDQIDGKKYLVENHGIDASELGFMGVLMEVSSR
jgi:dipeptidyl aminopeptidase/acylaminoacyl peptidase